MNKDKQKRLEEIAEFRLAGHKFLKKEMTAAEFKGISGGMGVYAQRGGEKFMIRLRIPSGVLSYKNLNLIEEFVKQYGLSKIHLTTREAIQLHDLDIDAVCDIMEKALLEDLYSRGTGGNFPRNATLSPLSGVECEEAFDATPYALLVSEYLMERITEYHLPRKLKISFSNSDKDSANATINDLGFIAVQEDGKPYFKLYIGGGLGNNPEISLPFDKLIPPEDVLYHVEAVTRLFMAEGDFNNKAKARLRYVKKRMGEEAFLNCYKGHLEAVMSQDELKNWLRVKGKSFNALADRRENVTSEEGIENYRKAAYGKEVILKEESLYLIPQKQTGLYTVILYPFLGQMPVEYLDKLVAFIDKYNPLNLTSKEVPLEEDGKERKIEVRLSMTESMYVRNLTFNQAKELLAFSEDMKKTARVQMSIGCIGVPTCQIGIEESQDLLKSILSALEKSKVNAEYLPPVHISGCPNSCSRHQVSTLGFAGCKKRGEEGVVDAFELHMGGTIGKDKTVFGKVAGCIQKEKIPEFMITLAKKLDEEKMEFEEFIKEREAELETILLPYLI